MVVINSYCSGERRRQSCRVGRPSTTGACTRRVSRHFHRKKRNVTGGGELLPRNDEGELLPRGGLTVQHLGRYCGADRQPLYTQP